jgi:hypothetical protein
MRAIIYKKLIIQTVEAEITMIMLLQRARDAEKRTENKSSNGPLRVQVKCKDIACLCLVFCNVWAYVSCRGYVGILPSA